MIQVYTGPGKGKTTASLGLALRAVGAGLKVYIAQFLKKGYYSELKALRKIKGIKIEQFGRGCFLNRANISEEDKKLAKEGLSRVKEIIRKKKFNLIVLDEINVALRFGLLDLKELIKLIKQTPQSIELVLTGRYAPKEIIKIADLVSYIKSVKHYYRKGIHSRKGIEF